MNLECRVTVLMVAAAVFSSIIGGNVEAGSVFSINIGENVRPDEQRGNVNYSADIIDALKNLQSMVKTQGQILDEIRARIPERKCPCDLTQNLALGKPAEQSSTFTGNGVNTNASIAVDGSLNNNGSLPQITHTNGEKSPWWYVDLQATVNVSSVNITNRGDCCGDRLRNFFVTLADESPKQVTPKPGAGKVCVYHEVAVDLGATIPLMCDTRAVGRYLIVQLNNITEILSLAEVQVFGCRL